MLKLEVQNVGKWFDSRRVFDCIDFTLEPGQSMAVVGPNGSGKTTLLKMIIGLILPTKGIIAFTDNGRKLDFEQYRRQLSLVAPYLSLYCALTARENLRFFSGVNGRHVSDDEIEAILTGVGLPGRADDYVSAYSSGMQQRLKYAVALLKDPSILLIDEPSANLDESGKKIAFDLIRSKQNDSIIIIATNEREEYSLADRLCQLDG
jgi:heme exporter protein A